MLEEKLAIIFEGVEDRGGIKNTESVHLTVFIIEFM